MTDRPRRPLGPLSWLLCALGEGHEWGSHPVYERECDRCGEVDHMHE